MDEVWDVAQLSVEQLTSLYATLNVEELSFENAMELLEKVIEKIEGGSLTLVQSLTLQEFGTKLGDYCNKLLDEKESRLEEIKSDAERVVLETEA